MLEIILFQMIMPFFINPADPDSNAAYKSGVDELEKSYPTDKPPTDYPMITLDVLVFDTEFNLLEPGIYAVDFVTETKTILILEGSKIIAKCPAIQVIQLNKEQKVAVPSAEIVFTKTNKIFIIYKNKNLEAHGFLYKSDDLPEAN
ncbi:MAG TPA: hypothetical protein P5556_10945 [Candidatus Gastranaerophilales bacterium]|nr:hypothetical protein [Candidatus Gastranaerophilales bacterium]